MARDTVSGRPIRAWYRQWRFLLSVLRRDPGLTVRLYATKGRRRLHELLTRSMRHSQLDGGRERPVIVYTAITGDYEVSPPNLRVVQPGWRYVCFADRLESVPSPWELVRVPSYFVDPKLTVNYLKANSHLLFPRDAVTVWVDSNCKDLALTPSRVLLPLRDGPVAVRPHLQRRTVRDELAEVRRFAFEDPARLDAVADAIEESGFPDDRGLSSGQMVVRDLSHPRARAFEAAWWEGGYRISRRDQLTLDWSLWSVGLRRALLDVDLFVPGSPYRIVEHNRPRGRVVDDERPIGARRAVVWGLPRREDGELAVASSRVVVPGERWSPTAPELGRTLNEVVATRSPRHSAGDGYLHDERCASGPWSPPDPRLGARREVLRRVAATSALAVDVGFAPGYASMLMLTSNRRLRVIGIPIGGDESVDAAADVLLGAVGPERWHLCRRPVGDCLDACLEADGSRSLLVHVHRGVPAWVVEAVRSWFLADAPDGALMLLSGNSAEDAGEMVAGFESAPGARPAHPGMLVPDDMRLMERVRTSTPPL